MRGGNRDNGRRALGTGVILQRRHDFGLSRGNGVGDADDAAKTVEYHQHLGERVGGVQLAKSNRRQRRALETESTTMEDW